MQVLYSKKSFYFITMMCFLLFLYSISNNFYDYRPKTAIRKIPATEKIISTARKIPTGEKISTTENKFISEKEPTIEKNPMTRIMPVAEKILKISTTEYNITTTEKIHTVEKILTARKIYLTEKIPILKKEPTEKICTTKNTDFKYILQWTLANRVPFVYMNTRQEVFIRKKCPYNNCIVTSNKWYLDDLTQFDAIVFAVPEVTYLTDFPWRRSPHQKYVFASVESAHNYPLCSNRYDGYFNWTWTFRLNSDVKWDYMVIRDKNNTIIGPKKEMNWIKIKDMDPISDDLKKQLSNKTKAATWFVSNCYTRSGRERFVESLRKEINKYALDLDIFGRCYNRNCSIHSECDRLIKDVYYFYLAFENSFDDDYVTEKILRALNNNAVPIVYGGANYSRFMPDGIYLNAKDLGIENLAREMYTLINDPEKYVEYFKWKNHYNYHNLEESVHTDPYCLICKHLNDQSLVHSITVYKNFRDWWDPPNICGYRV